MSQDEWDRRILWIVGASVFFGAVTGRFADWFLGMLVSMIFR